MIIERSRRELKRREKTRKQISRKKKKIFGCGTSSQQDTEDEEFS